MNTFIPAHIIILLPTSSAPSPIIYHINGVWERQALLELLKHIHTHTNWISQKSKKNGNEPFKRRKWHVACVYRIRERIDTWWISFSVSFSHFRTINSFVFCFSQLLIMRWSSPPITSNIDQSMFHKWEVSFLSFLCTYILSSSSTYLLHFLAGSVLLRQWRWI